MSILKGIHNIIFDLGGVILNIDFKVTQREFVKLGIKNIDDTFGQYHQLGFFDQFDRGEMDEKTFLEEAQKLFPQGVTPQQIIAAWNAMLFDLPAQRLAFLKSLGQQYRLFLMSNTNAIHHRAYQEYIRNAYGLNGLDDLFEKTYYSHLVHMRKPEKRFFDLILNENGLNAYETLFVDDTHSNVDAGTQYGIRSLLLPQNSEISDFLIPE